MPRVRRCLPRDWGTGLGSARESGRPSRGLWGRCSRCRGERSAAGATRQGPSLDPRWAGAALACSRSWGRPGLRAAAPVRRTGDHRGSGRASLSPELPGGPAAVGSPPAGPCLRPGHRKPQAPSGSVQGGDSPAGPRPPDARSPGAADDPHSSAGKRAASPRSVVFSFKMPQITDL